MKSPELSLPERLDLEGACAFGNMLSSQHSTEPVVLFDCSAISFVEPFGMLYAAQMIRQFKATYECEIAPIFQERAPARDYAAHMGFFQACGFIVGKKPGQARGSESYLPLTYQSVTALRESTQYRADVQRISAEIAQRLIQKNSGPLYTAVSYAVREVIRNVVEHSDATEFGYCAQYWPKKGEVEIAVIDGGIGLFSSLKQNPEISVTSDKEAIDLAIYPGVSSKVYTNAPQSTLTPNAGFGLYMLYRLCGLGGSFFLGSGSIGLEHTLTGQTHRHHVLALQGTVLSLRINGEKLKNFDNHWETFLAEGEAEAAKIEKKREAIVGSLSATLRDDFAPLKRKFAIGDMVRHARYGTGIVSEVLDTAQGEMLRAKFGTRTEKVAAHAVQLLTSLDSNSLL